MKAAETRASNLRRVAALIMVLRLLDRPSVTGELYHRPGAVVERAAGLGRRFEGPRAQAEREDVRDRAELLEVVLGEGGRLAAQEEAAARLADPQEEARLEASLDLLRVLRLARADARHLAEPRPLRLRAGLDRSRPEPTLVLQVVADPVGGDDLDDLGGQVRDEGLDGLLLTEHRGDPF